MRGAIVTGTLQTCGLILLGSMVSLAAGGTDFPHEKEAFRHIAGELQKHRVVALADFAHGNAYPYHTLMQVLSHWLDLAAPTGGRLVLALEMDAETTEILRVYLRTGDIEPVLAYWLPFSTLDQLAFYDDLREFTLRIRRVNEVPAQDRRMEFHIQGLETFSMWALGNPGQEALPDAAQAAKVANERDRAVVSALLACLQDRPRDKVLVFYGMDHLRIRETQNSWAGRLFGSTPSWQPMAFLLKQQLGDDFLSIAQSPLPPAALNPNGPYRDLMGRDVFLRSSDVPWKLNRIDPADFDAVVFPGSQRIDEARQVRYICSRRILEQAIAKLARIETLPQNDFTMKYAVPSSVVEGLRFITGQSFETAGQWKQWAEAHPYDGFARIDSNEFAEAIRRECCQPMNSQRSAMLASLGLPAAYFGRQQRISDEQWRELWPRLAPRIRFLQCAGICWIGHSDEREKAREYLVQFSGQELNSAATYLKWYRKTCLGLTY